MAENVIVAEDGSLIPTGDTQVEQVGEDAIDADTAGDSTDTIVGAADPSDTFALEGDRVFDDGEVVSTTDSSSSSGGSDSPAATPDSTDSSSDTSPASTTTETVRQVIVPTSSGDGGFSIGVVVAIGLALVAGVGALAGGD